MVAVWQIGAKHPVNFFVAGQKAFFRDQKNPFFLLTPSKDSRGVLLLPAHGLFFVATQKSVFANIPWNVLLPQVPDGSHLFTTTARVFVCVFKYLSCQPVLTF